MSGEYKVTIFFPNGVISISETGVCEIAMSDNSTLTADEMAAIGGISEIMTRLRTGKFVSYDFNPLSFEDQARMYKCEWLRSNNLKVHGPTDKPYRYCVSKEEALKKSRTFTCPKSLIALLPNHRESFA